MDKLPDLDANDWFIPFASGFFDGEGWCRIGLEPGNATRSDVHRLSVYVTQRARYRAVLDKFQSVFGGHVTVRDTKIKGSEKWAEQADWHIHTRPEIERFCRAVQPYCIVKAEQIAIALEFVTGFVVSPNVRDKLGRIRGRALSAAEVARRERLRQALALANARGPERTVQIMRESAPRGARRRDRSAETLTANVATVSRGESRYNSVLTEDAVRAIRVAYASGDVTMAALAMQYGVTPAAVRLVVRRLAWQHVE